MRRMCTCTVHFRFLWCTCLRVYGYSQQTGRWHNGDLMLGQIRKWRANIKPASGQHHIFTRLYHPATQILTLKLKSNSPRLVKLMSSATLMIRVSTILKLMKLMNQIKFELFVCGAPIYSGEPPWPRGSVLGLRPPGLEFRILCLEDSVISIISPSSGGSPGPV